jgi:hypothetical protein
MHTSLLAREIPFFAGAPQMPEILAISQESVIFKSNFTWSKRVRQMNDRGAGLRGNARSARKLIGGGIAYRKVMGNMDGVPIPKISQYRRGVKICIAKEGQF